MNYTTVVRGGSSHHDVHPVEAILRFDLDIPGAYLLFDLLPAAPAAEEVSSTLSVLGTMKNI